MTRSIDAQALADRYVAVWNETDATASTSTTAWVAGSVGLMLAMKSFRSSRLPIASKVENVLVGLVMSYPSKRRASASACWSVVP